jgi:hypothetical protein
MSQLVRKCGNNRAVIILFIFTKYRTAFGWEQEQNGNDFLLVGITGH